MLSRYLILSSLCCCLTINSFATPLHVVLDPGHGGHDTGATRGSISESKIVLDISRHLQKYLQGDPRFQVTMTRSTESFLRLSERAKAANNLKADVFISIHANASPDKRAKGLEVYFQNQLPPAEESMFLANMEHMGHKEEDRYSDRDELQGLGIPIKTKPEVKNILRDLIRSHRIQESSYLARNIVNNWNGSKKSRQHTILQAPFFVVSNLNMPSVLVEVGFVTHPKESKKLVDPEHQRYLAGSLYKSLIAYKESMDK